jgi:HTH-type transcriptional regulator/antitoxin HigA
MAWKTLENESDYKTALHRTIEIFHSEEGTPESDELDVLLLLVKAYEDIHYPIPEPNAE